MFNLHFDKIFSHSNTPLSSFQINESPTWMNFLVFLSDSSTVNDLMCNKFIDHFSELSRCPLTFLDVSGTEILFLHYSQLLDVVMSQSFFAFEDASKEFQVHRWRPNIHSEVINCLFKPRMHDISFISEVFDQARGPLVFECL